MKQRLAAILAADAAAYSRLMSLDEHATVVALDAARTAFRTQIEAKQGRGPMKSLDWVSNTRFPSSLVEVIAVSVRAVRPAHTLDWAAVVE
jgi:hypothetical protein